MMRGVWHHQDRRRRGPRELTGIVDHSREGPSHGPLEWTWSRVGLAPCMRTGWPSAANSFAPVSRSRRWIPSRDRKNAIDDQLQDATSVLDAFHIVKLAGDAPGEVRRRVQQDTTGHRGRKGDPLYQIRRHTRPRPTPGRSFHRAPTSLSHPRNCSPRGEPYASGRTPSWPTSIPTEPATAPRKPSTDIIELGGRIARGYRNPTSYQFRMLLIAGGLDASTHTQL